MLEISITCHLNYILMDFFVSFSYDNRPTQLIQILVSFQPLIFNSTMSDMKLLGTSLGRDIDKNWSRVTRFKIIKRRSTEKPILIRGRKRKNESDRNDPSFY